VTRNEARTKCFDAMEAAYDRTRSSRAGAHRHSLAAAFDSLHGIAVICPVEATEEMRTAAYDEERRAGLNAGSALILFRVMAAAGDLTKPSEKKT
jgi:hypothetical protein